MDRLRSIPPDRAVDIAVVVLILLFAWLGFRVHDSIAGLADMARGIRDTGTEIESSGLSTSAEIRRSVGEAADAIGSVPIVGSQAARAVRDTARVSAEAVERESRIAGRRLAVAGAQGEHDALATAKFVGWLAFLIPTVLLLAQVVPRRVAYVDGRWVFKRRAGPASPSREGAGP